MSNTDSDTDKDGNLIKNYNNFTLPRRPGTFTEKFTRMWTEQPFIPLGAGATCYFLVSGLRAMKGGDKHKSQMMMRGRVAMQAFTVVAIYLGIFYKTKYSLLPDSWSLTGSPAVDPAAGAKEAAGDAGSGASK